MSQPKLISPLLDGFVMGDPISDHDGVRCCPAMQTENERKYMVKIISVPASQDKLDALLLAGAFADKISALSYFRDLAQDVENEAAQLQRLSQLEGFLPYENWQVVPMEDGDIGFEVYLTNSYHPTLDRLMRRESLTHLSAVNLGLDLCAALSVCRRSGYLFVNLKPSNVYICDDREYRIGDLGFIPMESLEFASLPQRYLSAYTAPEIADAYSALNSTMDVYAAGLILYQAYNGGVLPFERRAGNEPLPVPQYADPEMAQIILKACDPNPEVRWQDPLQMGQALVTYLQSNIINDVPIVPAVPEEEEELAAEEEIASSEPSTEDILAEVDEALDAVESLSSDEETTEKIPAEEIAEEPVAEVPVEEATVEEVPEKTEQVQTTFFPEQAQDVEDVVLPQEEAEEESLSEEEAPETVSDEEGPEETQDAMAAEAAIIQETLGVTEEASQILAHAEDLIAHETPDTVVIPEPIDVPIPELVIPEPDVEDAPEEAASEEAEAAEDAAAPDAEEAEETEEEDLSEEEAPEDAPKKKSRKGLIAILVSVVLVAALAIGGYLFYQNYYLQTIWGITLDGTEDQLVVSLDTDVSSDLLSILCTDTYGNTMRKDVVDGKAVFEDLNPNTRYKITVEISGFHQLIGSTTAYHMTPEQTSILDFTATTGTEDGSVILTFTVHGLQTGSWKVTYSAEGEEEKSVTFSGGIVTLTGLTTGKEYTFRLESTTALYVTGTTVITHVASKTVVAEDLTIQGFRDNALTAVWSAPEGVTVEGWTVRCYNDKGYEKIITVTGTTAVFEDLDSTLSYTVEVTAQGMTLYARAFVSANSITIPTVSVDDSNRNQLTISWTYEGTAPEGGWLLLYTIDGSADQQVVVCPETTGVIFPIVPGSTYDISIQPASGNTVFGGTYTYESPAAPTFSGYLLSAEHISMHMCKTPNKEDWTQYDVPAADYTTTYTVGSKASFATYLNHQYNTSPDVIVTLFVIRDADGKIVSTATQSQTWTFMWYRGFGRINIPSLPTEAGNYTLDIYFNGAFVHNQAFTMVSAENAV